MRCDAPVSRQDTSQVTPTPPGPQAAPGGATPALPFEALPDGPQPHDAPPTPGDHRPPLEQPAPYEHAEPPPSPSTFEAAPSFGPDSADPGTPAPYAPDTPDTPGTSDGSAPQRPVEEPAHDITWHDEPAEPVRAPAWISEPLGSPVPSAPSAPPADQAAQIPEPARTWPPEPARSTPDPNPFPQAPRRANPPATPAVEPIVSDGDPPRTGPDSFTSGAEPGPLDDPLRTDPLTGPGTSAPFPPAPVKEGPGTPTGGHRAQAGYGDGRGLENQAGPGPVGHAMPAQGGGSGPRAGGPPGGPIAATGPLPPMADPAAGMATGPLPMTGAPQERPTESIVPDSWFAEPRRPDPRQADEATQQWTAMPQDGPPPPGHWDQPPPGQWDQWNGPPQHTEVINGGFTAVPGFNGHPGAPYGGPPSRQQAGKPLIIGVGALVVVALLALGLVMWPDNSDKAAAKDTPSTPPQQSQKASASPGRQQANAINALLNASAASRGELGRALAASGRCQGLPSAIQGMQRVAGQRRNQFHRARTLKVGALQNGPQLRSTLARSFRLSLEVDQAFLAWAQRASHKCKKKPRRDGNYRRGNVLSLQASESKKRFATLWAPVARKEGLRPRTATQF